MSRQHAPVHSHRRRRNPLACDRCRSRKARCSGGCPCKSCLDTDNPCKYTNPVQSGRSVPSIGNSTWHRAPGNWNDDCSGKSTASHDSPGDTGDRRRDSGEPDEDTIFMPFHYGIDYDNDGCGALEAEVNSHSERSSPTTGHPPSNQDGHLLANGHPTSPTMTRDSLSASSKPLPWVSLSYEEDSTRSTAQSNLPLDLGGIWPITPVPLVGMPDIDPIPAIDGMIETSFSTVASNPHLLAGDAWPRAPSGIYPVATPNLGYVLDTNILESPWDTNVCPESSCYALETDFDDAVSAADCGIENDLFQQCIDAYFRKFHPLWPVLHQATFQHVPRNQYLVQAMVMIGAWESGQPSHKALALRLHETPVENFVMDVVCSPCCSSSQATYNAQTKAF